MSQPKSVNSYKTLSTLTTSQGEFSYYRLASLSETQMPRLPFSIKVVLEGVLRRENGVSVNKDDILNLARYNPKKPAKIAIPFLPARVLMQDFTGVPAVVDLAALRSAMADMGGDPQRINPELPVDLVIDHSVQVDYFGSSDALEKNAELEFQRNRERYEFLHWGQKAFDNFRVVPPASGICHQVNLEYLGTVVRHEKQNGKRIAYFDSLVGCDSHTTMINGLGILGWGVGGIEAEAVVLGQPYFMMMPEVIGFKLTGKLQPGVTATDLVLTVTEMLREKGVVGKFVEFYGAGLSNISVTDRATIANMAPECGSRCSFFPVDDAVLAYLRQSGRDEADVELVEAYCKAQGVFRTNDTPDPEFLETLELDMSTVEPSLAGPKRPQDRIAVKDMKTKFTHDLTAPLTERGFELTSTEGEADVAYPDGSSGKLRHGDVVIAAITSCTNTSNPSVLIGAGVLAKKAYEAGLRVPLYIKTSLAPGSKVVTQYLDEAGLTPFLDKMGFHNVGYGCTTCIGNSGPLPEHISDAIKNGKLVASSVLSGNRNFEGRVNPHTRANYLASPPLVVAYAIAGTVAIDLSSEPIGLVNGKQIMLSDIWPTDAEIQEHMAKAMNPDTFRKIYDEILTGNETWNAIPSSSEAVYNWNDESTYIQRPPFFDAMSKKPAPIQPIAKARVLVKVGDSVTTDHISPAGSIPPSGPAGRYLISRGVDPADFNSYGSRRGNDRVMARGTFANIRIRNQIAPGTEGGLTTYLPTGEVTSIYEAAMHYQQAGTPTIVLAGVDYGMGSSRDWAAKGTLLLGVKAVIARSFETIHRSNLIGMGVLPLQFANGESADSLGLTGREIYNIHLNDDLQAGQTIAMNVLMEDGNEQTINLLCRLDTPVEVEYYRHGGILHMALRGMMED